MCPYCNCLTIEYSKNSFDIKKQWSEFNQYNYVPVICLNPECESEQKPMRLCLGYYCKKIYPTQGQ